jgi:hypothetical protein
MSEVEYGIILHEVVIRYPHLVTPWSSSPQYKADYNCQLIFPANWPEWPALQAAVETAKNTSKHWQQPPAQMKLPWLNKFLQPNLQKDGPYEGCYYINAAGKDTKPGVVGPDGKEMSDLQIPQLIFSGCIVNAWVNFFSYAGPGIGTALIGIQLVNNQVERIQDSARDVTQAFKPIAGAPAATAPTPGFGPGGPGPDVPW